MTRNLLFVATALALLAVSCSKSGSSARPIGGEGGGGEDSTVVDTVNLSKAGKANCYIVSKAGKYCFEAPDTTNSVVKVLWETYNTYNRPIENYIIVAAKYLKGGRVYFSTPKELVDGNAVIALVDTTNGNAVWSWHIWMCKGFEPEQTAHLYKDSLIVMDRNLGALTVEIGNPKSLGLLYQWGRKDPFPGGCNLSDNTVAGVSIEFPQAVTGSDSTGTVAFAVAHPTTFITRCSSQNTDWSYEGDADSLRWTSVKSAYDPCPYGWRVPDGGPDKGIWASIMGKDPVTKAGNWDGGRRVMEMTDRLKASRGCFYPAAGYIAYHSLLLGNVGKDGVYWSCTCAKGGSYLQKITDADSINPCACYGRAYGCSVRCIKIQ